MQGRNALGHGRNTPFHEYYYRKVVLWPPALREEAQARIAEAYLDVMACPRLQDVEAIQRDLEHALDELDPKRIAQAS